MYVNLILKKKETDILIGDNKTNLVQKMSKILTISVISYLCVMSVVVLARTYGG